MDATVERRIRVAIEEVARSRGVPIRDLEVNEVDIAIKRDLSLDELNQVGFDELLGIWKTLVDEEQPPS